MHSLRIEPSNGRQDFNAVKEQILQGCRNGTLIGSDGLVVTLSVLEKRLRANRRTIIKALKASANQGIVKIIHSSGARYKWTNGLDILSNGTGLAKTAHWAPERSVRFARWCNEPWAAMEAARLWNLGSPLANDLELAWTGLEAACADYSPDKRGSVEASVRADIAFHVAIHAFVQDQLLRDILAVLQDRLVKNISLVVEYRYKSRRENYAQGSEAEHRRIYHAITERNPMLARAAMSAHLERAVASIDGL